MKNLFSALGILILVFALAGCTQPEGNDTNGWNDTNGLNDSNGLNDTNGLNDSNGWNETNGLNDTNGLNESNGWNESNGLNDTNGDDFISTFTAGNNTICEEDGKPVIRLFSATLCPPCAWIKDSFETVAKEYADQGLIVAYHWELDTGDNALTPEVEQEVPQSETNVHLEFNPSQSIPTFVFGCKYYRIGTRYGANDTAAEEAEFRAVIDELLK